MTASGNTIAITEYTTTTQINISKYWGYGRNQYCCSNAMIPQSTRIPDYAACHSAEVDECANVKFVDRLELSAQPGFDNRPHDDKAHEALHQKP